MFVFNQAVNTDTTELITSRTATCCSTKGVAGVGSKNPLIEQMYDRAKAISLWDQ